MTDLLLRALAGPACYNILALHDLLIGSRERWAATPWTWDWA